MPLPLLSAGLFLYLYLYSLQFAEMNFRAEKKLKEHQEVTIMLPLTRVCFLLFAQLSFLSQGKRRGARSVTVIESEWF